MMLQSTLSPSTPYSLPSPLSSSSSPNGFPSFVSFPYVNTHLFNMSNSTRCSMSYIHNYRTMDNKKRPRLDCSNIVKRISNMEDPQLGVSSVLNQCEIEGKVFSKWELCKIVKALRRFKRYHLALKVCEWMNNKKERFSLSSSDTAIQLDLIAKVRGVTYAEDYFTSVPDTLKDKRIYAALLNAYVEAEIRDKAEALMEGMRNKGYAIHSLPYNVMMTLYMKLDEFDKVEELISEMKQKRIPLDSCTYNIWLSCRGSQSSEAMEQAFKEMGLDPTVVPDWSTFSTMAALYTKLGLFEKADKCLRKLETMINHRGKTPYHYLIRLYGNLGNREEVYRVWNVYKSVFPSIPNWGYYLVISSLVWLGDIEGAEKLYEEWLPVKSSYDLKIGNLLMGWYVKEELFEKVKGFFDHMIEAGGKPNSASWEILGEGHIKEGRIPEALACFKEAVLAVGAKNWRLKPLNVKAFLELCDREANQSSKDDFIALLTQMGYLQDENHGSLLTEYGGTVAESTDRRVIYDCISDTENEETESKDPEMILLVPE